ncbi:MAG: helix-turn-helix domain-containing protein [Exiguobacterium acetylicum]|jgi:excisionase family DNA binding protein
MDSQEMFTPLSVNGKTAARMLGVSERMFWELRNRGEIPHIKLGRLTRFAVEDLKRFLELKRYETEEDESNGIDEPPDEE